MTPGVIVVVDGKPLSLDSEENIGVAIRTLVHMLPPDRTVVSCKRRTFIARDALLRVEQSPYIYNEIDGVIRHRFLPHETHIHLTASKVEEIP